MSKIETSCRCNRAVGVDSVWDDTIKTPANIFLASTELWRVWKHDPKQLLPYLRRVEGQSMPRIGTGHSIEEHQRLVLRC